MTGSTHAALMGRVRLRAKAERVLALVDKDWDWPPGARRVVLTAALGSPLADSAERPSTAAPPPNPLAALSFGSCQFVGRWECPHTSSRIRGDRLVRLTHKTIGTVPSQNPLVVLLRFL
ncbi:hypothetical protein MyChFU_25130 [Mycobacterium intracellulare subsp. chimaera]